MKRIFSLLIICTMLLTLFSACKGQPVSVEKPSFDYEPTGVKIVENPFPNIDLTGMTEAQKAVVTTAESFYIRGSRLQYEGASKTKSPYYYRWALGQRPLEDYTAQNIGFFQCAAFCYEVYSSALDLSLVYNDKHCFATNSFKNYAKHVLYESPVESGFFNMTEEQLEKEKQELLDTLQPGDIIVYRTAKTNGTGHAMLYVGDNTIIHSSGSSSNWSQKVEKFEESGTIVKNSLSVLIEPGTSRYLFNKYCYFIVRPLADFTVTSIPQKSIDRIGVMRGVLAEKLASHTEGQTVSPGENITYTFSLKNTTKEQKTLTITDTLPAHTEFVSGDLTLNGTALSTKVTLPAEGEVKVSYTVRVNKKAPLKETIVSESFVESVPTNCPAVTIGKTLTQKKQDALLTAIAKLEESELRDLELVNAIYKKAAGYKPFKDTSSSEVLENLFRYYSDALENKTAEEDTDWPSTWRSLDPNSTYLSYIAPTLYGGQYVAENTSATPLNTFDWFKVKRTRIVTADHLLPGDILIISDDSETLSANGYLYTGYSLLDLQQNEQISPDPLLSQVFASTYFVVLRPSLAKK